MSAEPNLPGQAPEVRRSHVTPAIWAATVAVALHEDGVVSPSAVKTLTSRRPRLTVTFSGVRAVTGDGRVRSSRRFSGPIPFVSVEDSACSVYAPGPLA